MDRKERRQKRLPLFGVAEVNMGSDGKTFLCTALTQNITTLGMGLYMHHVLKLGTPLSIKLKFTMKDGTRPSDVIKGTVTSVSEIESFYCVGVRFDSAVNPEGQPNLYKHLVGEGE